MKHICQSISLEKPTLRHLLKEGGKKKAWCEVSFKHLTPNFPDISSPEVILENGWREKCNENRHQQCLNKLPCHAWDSSHYVVINWVCLPHLGTQTLLLLRRAPPPASLGPRCCDCLLVLSSSSFLYDPPRPLSHLPQDLCLSPQSPYFIRRIQTMGHHLPNFHPSYLPPPTPLLPFLPLQREM